MASPPILTVLEESQVPPPPATLSHTSLPLTFFDIFYLLMRPIHLVFFYDLPLITTAHFIETIVPSLKHSLSITLQHFFPYAGNLIVFPDRTKKPEIRYAEGDSVKVTFAECNLDFNDLTGYHPRNCDNFYHLIPLLGDCLKMSDFVKIPVFSLQVTIFPNCGISIGMSTHHCLVDATTQFNFLNAWTSISRHGTDESFLANGTLPVYERLINYPEKDKLFLERINLETFNKGYQLPRLSGPTDKVRATFVLKRTFIDELKKWMSTKLPTLPYASSFMVCCAYIWCCLAQSRRDEYQMFIIPTDSRARLDPPIPASYFGNCAGGCRVIVKTTLLTGKEGLKTAAKALGENLHKVLSSKDGTVKDMVPMEVRASSSGNEIRPTVIAIAGTPKLKLYDMDFGWGKPKKLEWISLDYGASISVDTGKESEQDLEVGVCLTATQMNDFVRIFNLGLEPYV